MIEQHKHCPMCGKPIPLSERFCSPKCEQVAIDNQKMIHKTRIIMYVVIGLFVLVVVYFTMRGRFSM